MVMQEQSKRLAQPLQWTGAGRVAVIVTVLVLAIGTVVAVVASTGKETLAPGCIQVTFASTLGAAVVHPCGARAREVCAKPADNPGLAEHGKLRDACRRAGLPYASG
jgi:hypothetical protein